MSRMSARFFGQKILQSTEWVYGMWKDMGLVIKDKFGDWDLTDWGKQNSGKMSKGSRFPVPTFVFEVVEPMMIDFYNKHRK